MSAVLFQKTEIQMQRLQMEIQLYKLDVTEKEAYAKLREEFAKNKHVTDLRVIDLLVVKVPNSANPYP
uniref:Uncharacterized protein n=1 Tax=Magallana gigas TaxID=29159 RepID=K1PEL5_MAGGI